MIGIFVVIAGLLVAGIIAAAFMGRRKAREATAAEVAGPPWLVSEPSHGRHWVQTQRGVKVMEITDKASASEVGLVNRLSEEPAELLKVEELSRRADNAFRYVDPFDGETVYRSGLAQDRSRQEAKTAWRALIARLEAERA